MSVLRLIESTGRKMFFCNSNDLLRDVVELMVVCKSNAMAVVNNHEELVGIIKV
jgi:hypothetical protein